MNKDTEGRHGVESLEIGISILRAITQGHRSMMLKDIALSAEMLASKVHRYTVSLVRSGLVYQDTMTSLYFLKRGNTESGRSLIISNRFKRGFLKPQFYC